MDLSKVGRIGKGLNYKLKSEYFQHQQEKFKKLLGASEFSKFLNFSTVTEDQLIKIAPPSNMYTKGKFAQSRSLLYKIHKAEAKLVRSILELAGFNYTDSHDWNIM